MVSLVLIYPGNKCLCVCACVVVCVCVCVKVLCVATELHK